LIGVNVNGYDAGQLKQAVARQKLTWRSFADPGVVGQGPIAARWNLTATPTFYVLDHKGVIRHKWVGSPGEKVMDAAIDKLVAEAEEDARRGPQ
jgi:hypothetical protein